MAKAKPTFTRYNSMSVKVKLIMLQEALISLGYDKVTVNGKRDKVTIKALMDVQSKNGLTPNGTICSKTYDLLPIKNICKN